MDEVKKVRDKCVKRFMDQHWQFITIFQTSCLMSTTNGKSWLKMICDRFLKYIRQLHLVLVADSWCNDKLFLDFNHEDIFVTLVDIITCVSNIEHTVKAGRIAWITRKYFVIRLQKCMINMWHSVMNLNIDDTNYPVRRYIFVILLDTITDHLNHFISSRYADNCQTSTTFSDLRSCEVIHRMTDYMVNRVSALAKVSLGEDQINLRALCEKVVRDRNEFHEECVRFFNHSPIRGTAHFCRPERQLKAHNLLKSLHQLDDYVNESLLRLVFRTFRDYDRFSVSKLRDAIRAYQNNETVLDMLAADFDINLDRTRQISIFAYDFASKIKTKTILRSIQHSLSSLDAHLIPTLQILDLKPGDINSELLEQHYVDELEKFKSTIQILLDSREFVMCFANMLDQTIKRAEQGFDKSQLLEITYMGEFVEQHFQLDVNFENVSENPIRLLLFKKFILMLRECQAILTCADQVDSKRIIKRFKILNALSYKLGDSLTLSGHNPEDRLERIRVINDNRAKNSQHLYSSIGVGTSTSKFFYNDDQFREQPDIQAFRDSNFKAQSCHNLKESNKVNQETSSISKELEKKLTPLVSTRRSGLYKRGRDDSLRTTIFKRRKLADPDSPDLSLLNDSLEITEILDQISDISSRLSDVSAEENAQDK